MVDATRIILSLIIAAICNVTISARAQVISQTSSSLSVYPGCAVPPSKQTGNNWYVDPANGNDNNSGTAAEPWATLAGALKRLSTYNGTGQAVNPNGPLKGGDVINLMTGDYGVLQIGSYTTASAAYNKQFVTIKAALGQTPVFTQIRVTGASHWIFQGLKIQALVPLHNGGMFYVYPNANTVDNIILDSGSISSADDDIAQHWGASDFAYNAKQAIDLDGGGTNPYAATCVAVTNNKIKWVRSSVALMTSNTLFLNNKIDQNADDAVDYAASNLLIAHNVITNEHNLPGDSTHPDCMQGQIGRGIGGVTVYSNVTIDSNVCMDIADPNLQYPGVFQGIDAFDMDWSNLIVTNNVVVIGTYHGISFASVHNGLIANNTVLNNGGRIGSCLAGGNAVTDTWLDASPSTHEGKPSNGLIIRNNVVKTLNISDPAATIDHNMAESAINVRYGMPGYTTCRAEYENKVEESVCGAPGTYGDHNYISPTIFNAAENINNTFVAYDTINANYDVHLIPGAKAIGLGTSIGAPPVDSTGRPLNNPPDIGAFQYTTPYQGTITIVANARLVGSPALKVAVDGVAVGTVNVAADTHIGQTGRYTISFAAATKPQKIDVTLDGYGSSPAKYVSLGIFNFLFSENNGRVVDLMRPNIGIVKAGQIDLSSSSASFWTNGSTLEFNVGNF